MGYDAVCLSPHDLAAGAEFFTGEPEEAASFTWLSANVSLNGGVPFFQPYLIKKFGDATLAIIGLTGKTALLPSDFTVGDWRASLRSCLDDIGSKATFFIVLSTLSPKEEQELARNFPKINLILGSSPNKGNTKTILESHTLLVQTTSRGKYLGQLDIDYGSHGQWSEQKKSDVTRLKKRLAQVEKSLAVYLRSSNGSNQESIQQTISILSKQKESLTDRIEELQQTQTMLPEKGRDTFALSFHKIRPVSESSAIDDIVDKLDASF